MLLGNSNEVQGIPRFPKLRTAIGRESFEQLDQGGFDWAFPVAKSGLCLFILYTCIETLALSFIPYNEIFLL